MRTDEFSRISARNKLKGHKGYKALDQPLSITRYRHPITLRLLVRYKHTEEQKQFQYGSVLYSLEKNLPCFSELTTCLLFRKTAWIFIKKSYLKN